MRCTMRAKETDSGWPALAGRRAVSLSFGLWQITHSSIALRWPPCSERLSWHWLHCAIVTEVRRGVAVPPVIEAYLIGLTVDSCSAMSAPPSPRFNVALRRMSALIVHVPVASGGMALVNV